MRLQLLLTWLLVLACCTSVLCVESESESKPRPSLPIGTSTRYWPQQDASTYQPAPDTCQPVLFNLVARHGSRFPTSGHVKKLSQLQTDLSILATDPGFDRSRFGWMLTWTNPFAGQHTHDGELIALGMSQHFDLASRFSQLYPKLLGPIYDSDLYAFQATHVARTQVSGQSFAYGLFAGSGPLGPAHYLPISVPNNPDDPDDQVLRFFAACDNYIDNIKGSTKDDAAAYTAAHTGPMISRIQNLLNLTLPTTRQLINDSLEVMWSACQYHIEIQNQTDSFCTLFTWDDISLFVSISDVTDYVEKSYGHSLNWQIAAPLMNDIIQTMTDKMDTTNPSPLTASLRFAHAETIMPLVSMLGLFEDPTPLSFDMTPQQLSKRVFQTSVVSTMAANSAFILYGCDDNTTPYRVKLLHNEKEYVIPGCSSVYCPYSEFVSLFNWTLSYDFNAACADNQQHKPQKPNLTLI